MPSPSIALTRLLIRNFRGIESLDLDFNGPDGRPNQLAVLAGPNGSGKTAALEAALIIAGGHQLAIGPRGRKAVRKGADEYEIVGAFLDESNTPWTVQDSSGDGPPSARADVPHWYCPSSRVSPLIGPLNVSVKGIQSSRPKPPERDRLRAVKQQLINEAAKERFRNGRSSLETRYGDWIRAINTHWCRFYPEHPGEFTVDLADDEAGGAFDVFYVFPDGCRLGVDYLSSGQHELFLFLASLSFNGNREGLVFIDEPELHLDPQWHRLVLACLLDLQPRAQFLIATHSPEIYDSARSYERHYLATEDDARSRIWKPTTPNGAGV